jgi:hypothetical protein
MKQINPDDLDIFIARSGKRGGGCSIGNAIKDLENGAFKDRLLIHMRSPDVSHVAISQAFQQFLDLKVAPTTVNRHRLGRCSCIAGSNG